LLGTKFVEGVDVNSNFSIAKIVFEIIYYSLSFLISLFLQSIIVSLEVVIFFNQKMIYEGFVIIPEPVIDIPASEDNENSISDNVKEE